MVGELGLAIRRPLDDVVAERLADLVQFCPSTGRNDTFADASARITVLEQLHRYSRR